MLTNVFTSVDQSMECYLCHIKTLADSLAAIQNLVSKLELIQFTTVGLPLNYHSFVTTYSMMPECHSFDDVLSKLIFDSQILKFRSTREALTRQTLVTTVSTSNSNQGGGSHSQNRSNGKGKSK